MTMHWTETLNSLLKPGQMQTMRGAACEALTALDRVFGEQAVDRGGWLDAREGLSLVCCDDGHLRARWSVDGRILQLDVLTFGDVMVVLRTPKGVSVTLRFVLTRLPAWVGWLYSGIPCDEIPPAPPPYVAPDPEPPFAGFTVTCGACGSTDSRIDDDVSASYEDPALWGEVVLVCRGCNHKATIWSA